MADWTEAEKNARRQLHGAIQATNDTDESLEGSILVGWAVVAEWSDPEGRRWLSRLSGTAGGEESPPTWTIDGYLFHALNKWDEVGEEEG